VHAHLKPIRALAGLLLLLLCASIAPAATGDYFVYIGAYTLRRGKGIYTFRFNSATGKVTALAGRRRPASASGRSSQPEVPLRATSTTARMWPARTTPSAPTPSMPKPER